MGTVTLFPVLEDTPELPAIQACYIAQHPDARWWLPGPREPHIVSPLFEPITSLSSMLSCVHC